MEITLKTKSDDGDKVMILNEPTTIVGLENIRNFFEAMHWESDYIRIENYEFKIDGGAARKDSAHEPIDVWGAFKEAGPTLTMLPK